MSQQRVMFVSWCHEVAILDKKMCWYFHVAMHEFRQTNTVLVQCSLDGINTAWIFASVQHFAQKKNNSYANCKNNAGINGDKRNEDIKGQVEHLVLIQGQIF